MGDISIISRKLLNGKIEYGWSGNGGTPSSVGKNLYCWYNTSEKVDKLFQLGQLWNLGIPDEDILRIQKESNGKLEIGIDKAPRTVRNIPKSEDRITPHWIGDQENEIYSKIMFIDHAYMYETNNKWYYITPCKRIKIPLEYVITSTNICKLVEKEELNLCGEDIENWRIPYGQE